MPTLIGIALWALIPGFIARKKGRSFWAYYFLSFIITPLITMIVTLCVSDLTKGSEPEAVVDVTAKEVNDHDVNAVTYVENKITTSNPAVCPYCGFELLEGSAFCTKCGAKIEKAGE